MNTYHYYLASGNLIRALVGRGQGNLTCAKTAPTADCRPRVEILLNPIHYSLSPKTRSTPRFSFSCFLYLLYVIPFISFRLLCYRWATTLETNIPTPGNFPLSTPSHSSTSVHQPLRQAHILREAAGREPTISYNESRGLPSLHTSRPLVYQAKAQSIR